MCKEIWNTYVYNFFVLGQPQMVKVVQNRSTELNAQVKLKQTPGKVIKLASSEGNTQVKLIYC